SGSSPTTATRTSAGPPTQASSPTWRSSRQGCAKQPPNASCSLLAPAEPDRVLADGYEIAIGKLLLDHGLAIDQGAVRAAEVADPERPGANLDAAVPAGSGRVADDAVVVGCASGRDHLIR